MVLTIEQIYKSHVNKYFDGALLLKRGVNNLYCVAVCQPHKLIVVVVTALIGSIFVSIQYVIRNFRHQFIQVFTCFCRNKGVLLFAKLLGKHSVLLINFVVNPYYRRCNPHIMQQAFCNSNMLIHVFVAKVANV